MTTVSSVFTLDKVLANAKSLVTCLKEQEATVEALLSQTQDLSKKVESMKMYEENLNALNELAKHRPQAELTVGLFQESSEISQLQQENAQLRQSLDDHQSAIELIMSRYRSRVSRLVAANRRQRAQYEAPDDHSQAHEKIQNIQEMADVMWSAVTADSQPTDITEHVARLQLENATLRELLSAGRHSLASPVCSQAAQTDIALADDDVSASVSSCSETSGGNVVNSTVLEASSRHEPTPSVTATVPQTGSSAPCSSPPAACSASDNVTSDVTQQETN